MSVAGEVVITGLGICSAIGQGKDAFLEALLDGRHAFDTLSRPGRQHDSQFIGAEMPELDIPDSIPKRLLRTASLSGTAALVAVDEAWDEARLSEVAPDRIGMIVGGSNFQQREQMLVHEACKERPEFVRPTYAFRFLDTDLTALCTARFGIRGPAYSVGGASASGQLAVLKGIEAVRSGIVDSCIAIGALMDLSFLELQALHSLGAMGTTRFEGQPAEACRPFDRNCDGFIFGEACAAVVVERAGSGHTPLASPYARATGWATVMDANRNPNPSLEGEVEAIRRALEMGGHPASQVDYVNPHGTASPTGDATELAALRKAGLGGARINATKSLTGHGLTAAGAVEVVATLLQMRCGRLHPTRNLVHPVDPDFNWLSDTSVSHDTRLALTLSMGFGGINTALCLESLPS